MYKTKIESKDNVLKVIRRFNAPLKLVWKAWTEADLLDQWWAPKPWNSQTKFMNFEEGGHRLYAMVGPDGQEHWGRTDFKSIQIHHSFSGEDSFCDSDGVVNKEFPVALFSNTFEKEMANTKVIIITEYASKEHLNQVIEMGMSEGLIAVHENMDRLLKTLVKEYN